MNSIDYLLEMRLEPLKLREPLPAAEAVKDLVLGGNVVQGLGSGLKLPPTHRAPGADLPTVAVLVSRFDVTGEGGSAESAVAVHAVEGGPAGLLGGVPLVGREAEVVLQNEIKDKVHLYWHIAGC